MSEVQLSKASAVLHRGFQLDIWNKLSGRLAALKECLRYGIVPFIIEDSKKMFYYRGLSEWKTEKGWLTDTCLDGQDTFIRLLDMLDIPHP